MKKPYRCTASVVGSKYLGIFWAESEQEAIKMAEVSDAAHVSLCHHCSDQCEDAEVEDISAEEISEQEAEEVS